MMYEENILPEFDHIKEENEEIIWATKPKLIPYVLISLAFAAVVIITQMLSVYGNAFSMLFGNKPFSAEPFFDAFTFFLVALGLCAWQYWVYQNESYAYSNKRVMLRTGTFSTNFVAIDYKKIIEVKVTINPIEQAFGVGTLCFFTGKNDKNGSAYDCWHCIENPYQVMKEINKHISLAQNTNNQNPHQEPAQNHEHHEKQQENNQEENDKDEK